MSTVPLEVLTPEGTVVSGDVEFVVLPGVDGELGVLPGHMPLLAPLAAGRVRYITGDQESRLVTTPGLADITPHHVRIFTTSARREY